jgi:hypothetical protein
MDSAEHAETPPGSRFGEAAEQYDAARPGYAEEVATEVLAYADLRDRPAVEVGAGTGKASVLFAARGIPVVCVEPDLRMAKVLRRNTARYPQVQVEVSAFEEWEPGGRRFGLLYAATSWHWLNPARRWGLAHAAVEPGGTVALFWNPQGVMDAELHSALAEIDHRHGINDSPHADLASAYDDEPGMTDGQSDWPEAECRRDGRFTDLRAVRFRHELQYQTGRYLDFLASVSTYRILPADRRTEALGETGRLLDAHGGGISMLSISDLFLARVR